jgi:hypothetical protein
MELTKQEERAIELLKKAARHWPESLWLYSASGTLYVMKKDADGKRIVDNDDFIIDYIKIENDGGDW